MTEKKKHKHEEQVEEVRAEAVAESNATEQQSAEIEALKKQLEEANAKTSEFRESWMRSQAEFQNYKKRLERDNE